MMDGDVCDVKKEPPVSWADAAMVAALTARLDALEAKNVELQSSLATAESDITVLEAVDITHAHGIATLQVQIDAIEPADNS